MDGSELVRTSVEHASFSLERIFKSPPAKVFRAFADETEKMKWFDGGDGWTNERHEFDFRIGGKEYNSGRFHGGVAHNFSATYLDIVPEQRIVCVYEMYEDETRHSISLATFEFESLTGGGTRLTWTEQGAFLDGLDFNAQREEGTKWLLDSIVRMVDGA